LHQLAQLAAQTLCNRHGIAQAGGQQAALHARQRAR
jgi:hypothetical protein